LITRLSDGDIVAVVTNWASSSNSGFYFSHADIGLSVKKGDLMHIRDLVAKKDIGVFDFEQAKADLFIEKIPAHGSKVYRFNLINSGSYDIN
jgi:hypothetical protein